MPFLLLSSSGFASEKVSNKHGSWAVQYTLLSSAAGFGFADGFTKSNHPNSANQIRPNNQLLNNPDYFYILHSVRVHHAK